MRTILLLCAVLAVGLGLFLWQEGAKSAAKYPGQFPLHPDTEYFLRILSNGQEAISKPTPSFFKLKTASLKPLPVFSCPNMSYETPFPRAAIDFIGSDVAGDHYAIEFQADAVSPVQKKEIVYTGSSLEAWKDTRYALGMRPAKAEQ